MRTYRVTLYRPCDTAYADPRYFIGEVEDHQRGDDAMHEAMLAHPGMRAHHCSLVSREKAAPGWPALACGTLQ